MGYRYLVRFQRTPFSWMMQKWRFRLNLRASWLAMPPGFYFVRCILEMHFLCGFSKYPLSILTGVSLPSTSSFAGLETFRLEHGRTNHGCFLRLFWMEFCFVWNALHFEISNYSIFCSFEISFSFILAGLTLAAKDGSLGFAVKGCNCFDFVVSQHCHGRTLETKPQQVAQGTRSEAWRLGVVPIFMTFWLLDSSWDSTVKIRRADEGQLIPKGCGWSRFLSHRTQAGVILKPKGGMMRST